MFFQIIGDIYRNTLRKFERVDSREFQKVSVTPYEFIAVFQAHTLRHQIGVVILLKKHLLVCRFKGKFDAGNGKTDRCSFFLAGVQFQRHFILRFYNALFRLQSELLLIGTNVILHTAHIDIYVIQKILTQKTTCQRRMRKCGTQVKFACYGTIKYLLYSSLFLPGWNCTLFEQFFTTFGEFQIG